MQAEIISVGTEILLGEILDTNAKFLSEKLADLGIDVLFHSTVGDNEDRLRQTIRNAAGRADLVFLIGGLGPTEDDVTKESLANELGLTIQTDPNVLNQIKQYFESQNRPMAVNNERQAWMIEGSQPINNENGLAIGLFLENGSTNYIVLPGPPSEFEQMVTSEVMPLLIATFNLKQTILSRTLHFTDITESQLAQQLQPLVDKQTNPTIALYFKPTDITVRITAKAKNENEAQNLLDDTENEIINILPNQFYSDQTVMSLNQYVVERLKKQQRTITAAESLTGGLFQSEICDVSGASEVFKGGFVTYSNAAKSQLVGVSSKLIAEKGVVSAEVAEAMAVGARKKMLTDIAISFTGVAGPNELEGHPAGNFWIGLSVNGKENQSFEFNVHGSRQNVRQAAVTKGLQIINQELKK